MKAKIITIIAVLLVMGYSIVTSAQKNESVLRTAFGDYNYDNCGLNKLSTYEQDHLMNLLVSRPLQSFTRESAKNYMIEEGWRKVRVLGVIPPENTMRDHLVLIWDNYELITLDPFYKPYLPEPGMYWASNTLSSWKLLSTEGEEISFTERELR